MAQLSPVKPGGAEEEVSSWSALPGGAALPVQWRSPASASCRALPFPQGAVAWWSQALSLPSLGEAGSAAAFEAYRPAPCC